MTKRLVPFFVLLGLISASFSLVACSEKDTPKKNGRAVGYDTKLGRTLTVGEWCSDPAADVQNRSTFSVFRFRADSKFTLTRYVLNHKSQTLPEGTDEGTWALIQDKLFLTRGGQQIVRQIKDSEREDGTPCLKMISATGDEKSVCTCDIE
ncbi:MAG: hypothetical protein HC902_11300 [Calothrix sp. SM1_5_4]|nr:hypothetical protein [Calothrix sp. SM1_5_4]